jgi:hypothetical protein
MPDESVKIYGGEHVLGLVVPSIDQLD